MKLGTQTNSLVNNIYSRSTKNAPTPVVGMGATILLWTDRNPATVVSIDKNIITVQEDSAVRIDHNGMSEMQEYEYTRDPEGSVYHFRQDKTGSYTQVRRNEATGRWNKIDGVGLVIGFRRKYHDFSF